MALACIYVAIESVGRDDAVSEPLPAVPLPGGDSKPLDAVLLHVFGITISEFSSALELVLHTQTIEQNTGLCGYSAFQAVQSSTNFKDNDLDNGAAAAVVAER
jgi:hypothetical protein